MNKGEYVLVNAPNHPRRHKDGKYWQHIIVCEQILGRQLRRWESVHHINEIKNDNRPENLFVCSRKEHDKAHNMQSNKKRRNCKK